MSMRAFLAHISRLRVRSFSFPGSPKFFTQSHVVLQNRKPRALKPAAKTPKRKKKPFHPSPEQRKIAALSLIQNIIVSARPGSGKTATTEAIVANSPHKRIIVLTYSKKLQVETSRRLKDFPQCEVLTFHGMAGKLLGSPMRNDVSIQEEREKLFSRKELPAWGEDPFDIIILDEFQDCTYLLFWLVCCIIRANGEQKTNLPARIVVLGDERQAIYKFRGADSCFLTLVPEILHRLSPYPFARVPLSSSFRLTDEMADFINNVFLGGEPYINGIKKGKKPVVLVCDPWKTALLAKRLSALIKEYGYRNTAIIAPATRRNKPLQNLVNRLSDTYKIPIYLPINDGDYGGLDEKIVSGKLFVSTIHMSKGTEHKLVILLGIDDSFFTYHGRTLARDRCPNEIFVALTRAKSQLVLIHAEKQKLMPFMSLKALRNKADIEDITTKQAGILHQDEPAQVVTLEPRIPSSIAVTHTTKYSQDIALRDIIQEHLYIRQLSPPLDDSEDINMSSVVYSDKMTTYEPVSDLNGLVVAAAFEYAIAGTLLTLGISPKNMEATSSLPPPGSKGHISWLCQRACQFAADTSGYKPRLNQMEGHPFDWMAVEDLERATRRNSENIRVQNGQQLAFEFSGQRTLHISNHKVILYGRPDIVAYTNSSNRATA